MTTKPMGVPNPPITLAAASLLVPNLGHANGKGEVQWTPPERPEAPGVVDLLGQPAVSPELRPATSAVVAVSTVKATTAEVMSPIANKSAARESASGRSDLPPVSGQPDVSFV